MLKLIVALSGSVGSGKSTLAKGLSEGFGLLTIKTREFLLKRVSETGVTGRRDLQEAGDQLDRQTNGRWVADYVERELRERPEEDVIVVLDAVRIRNQLEALYSVYGPKVVHIHLTASEAALERRYSERARRNPLELTSYAAVRAHPTEANVAQMEAVADVVIDTELSTVLDVRTRASSRLGLYGSTGPRTVDVMIGGQYGSEGKGNIAFYLAPEYDILVRVGGPNAGHKVMPWAGDPVTHHHLPSGTLNNLRSKLVIGPGATIRIPDLFAEVQKCGIEGDRLAIDPQAMIITDDDRSQEAELVSAIGSTGQGVGAAMARRIRERGNVRLARDHADLVPYLKESAEIFEKAYSQGLRIFLEGTQGTGLSIYHGAYPYVTSRDTTTAGCLAEAGIAPGRVRKVVMTCRTYPIRVQNPPGRGRTSGPMSQEIRWAVVEQRAGFRKNELLRRERTSTTNRRRRVGEFDWAQLKRSSLLNAPSDIALTFVDYLHKPNQDARRFDQLSQETIRFIEEVEAVAQAPVSLISTRFHSRSVIDRRDW